MWRRARPCESRTHESDDSNDSNDSNESDKSDAPHADESYDPYEFYYESDESRALDREGGFHEVVHLRSHF